MKDKEEEHLDASGWDDDDSQMLGLYAMTSILAIFTSVLLVVTILGSIFICLRDRVADGVHMPV